MSSVDHFCENRRIVESVLEILEHLAVRLDTGEPLPNAVLADVVDFLRQYEHASYEASEASAGTPCVAGCVAQHATARALVRNMQWALESLERNEAGAVGAFVISAREYIRTYRDHVGVDDAYFPTLQAGESCADSLLMPPSEQMSQDQALLGRFIRLVERYRGLRPPAN